MHTLAAGVNANMATACNLEGVEFSTLPSGLHLVPQDVVCVPPILNTLLV